MSERDVLVLLLVASYGALLAPALAAIAERGQARWVGAIRWVSVAGLVLALVPATYRIGLAAVTVGFLAILFTLLSVLDESQR
jgi:hypothetical protein